jgi:hypothetical protein
VPLDDWDHERLVVAARGIGKHVVRFVDYDGKLFALKELPERLAQREYRFLRALEHEAIPAVEPVGIVRERGELPDTLITRYLDFSLPCRLVIARELVPGPLGRIAQGIADLLVRLHLAGFYWGDCSLSNVLMRRDAGALAAYLVDAETGERQPALTEGQREYDLEIAEQNVFGELLDLEEALGPDESRDPFAVSADVRERYESLWDELTGEVAFTPGERHRLDERVRRLNELGFDVEEVDLVSTDEGYRLRVDPAVSSPATTGAASAGSRASTRRRTRPAGCSPTSRASGSSSRSPAARRSPRPRQQAAGSRTSSSPPSPPSRPTCGASARRPSSTTSCSSTAGTSPSRPAVRSAWTRPSTTTSRQSSPSWSTSARCCAPPTPTTRRSAARSRASPRRPGT